VSKKKWSDPIAPFVAEFRELLKRADTLPQADRERFHNMIWVWTSTEHPGGVRHLHLLAKLWHFEASILNGGSKGGKSAASRPDRDEDKQRTRTALNRVLRANPDLSLTAAKRQVARDLDISLRTVHRHVGKIV
jgi:hypothetical protein